MATFLLFELLNGLRIHPMQYLMVGFAMCLFFQLLLAFSEHVGFVTAYLVAAAATVTTITLYSSTVLRTRRRAAVLGTSLAGLYGVLFVLVQLQTYTLVVGSVALFAVLVAFMYLTRGLDWYRLGRRQPSGPGGALERPGRPRGAAPTPEAEGHDAPV
jgi:inner membrane protein